MKVPLPLLGKTKAEIDRMITINVISRVDEKTDWCAPMVVIPKASGEVRICVDLTKLNQSIKEKHTPFHLLILHYVNWVVQRFYLILKGLRCFCNVKDKGGIIWPPPPLTQKLKKLEQWNFEQL